MKKMGQSLLKLTSFSRKEIGRDPIRDIPANLGKRLERNRTAGPPLVRPAQQH
jgi:hypothetical protein